MFYSVDKVGRLLLEGADKAEAGEMDRVVRIFFVLYCLCFVHFGEMDRVVRNLVFCFVINVLALSNLERRIGW